MSTAAVPQKTQKSAYTRLGTGGSDDRLGFRLVVALLWRCIGMLRPVRWHVVLLGIGYSLLGAAILSSIVILFDLFWTRALEGQPLTETSAASLSE